MRAFGLADGKPEHTRSRDPLMMTENWVAYATRGGVFHPQVKPGDRVRGGQVIAVIKDVFGETVEEIVSPKTGLVRIQHPRRVVNSGNPVFRGWVVSG
jgi:predicted deacylase